MRKFYTLFLFTIILSSARSQECGLQLSCAANESRCVATGSIQVTATGGTGDYNYKAAGTVSTPYTSSSLITGLPSGYYTITVQDITAGCTTSVDSVFVPGSYADPRFELIKTDAGCSGNDGTISAVNAEFGRSPFTFSIIAPSPSAVGTSNTAGVFSSLVPGEYSVQLQDSCGGIQVRKITIENYDWWFDSTSVQKTDCDNVAVYIGLADNKGNNNVTGTAFDGFAYGVVAGPGDTAWNNTFTFSQLIGKKRSLVLLAKDRCGILHSTTWTMPSGTVPSIGDVELSYFTCTNFKASLTSGQNLTNPEYCLYDSTEVLIECNQTGIFSDLSYGSYCIKITDVCYDTVITRCFVSSAPIPSVGADVSINDQECPSFSATVVGQANLIDPTYCILNAANDTLACNVTGHFANLAYGSYCILIRNGCSDTTITRCFTFNKPVPVLSGYTTSANDCSSFNVTASGTNVFQPLYCLYDSTGAVVACDSTGMFQNLPHGNYCIRAISCGDTTAALCFSGNKPIPSVANWVQVTDRACAGFTATITGQTNLSAPQYCLLNAADSVIACNTTGIFTAIPYGSYCIAVHDSCTDSTLRRCFTELQPQRTVNSTVEESNRTCSTLTAKLTTTNFLSPQYCAFNSQNILVACNATGIFNNLPYGSYCFTAHDGCIDTTITICRTFSLPKGISVTSSKSCTIGSGTVSVQFSNANGPYRIKIFTPDGLTRYDTTTNANPFKIQLANLPEQAEYMIVGIDGCNQKDTSFISPNATILTKSITVKSKCPTARFQNGAGDLVVKCSSNYYTVQPKIIRKGASNFNKNHSSVSNGVYTFSDLEPATYVVEYKMQSCGSRVYDTVGIGPYRFPSQGKSAIYQCNSSGLSLSADVEDGIGPYNYQIIGSTPASPSINTSMQADPLFSINNGTQYSLIRMRSIDACGNATLDDVSVLPLQNISVKASQLCFFQEVSLTVDTVPNATYEWYRKSSPTDSTLIGSGLSYNLPFFKPEERGTYVCKLDVNNGCLTRVSSFLLDGNCGYTVLATGLQLKGKVAQGMNQLSWSVTDEKTVTSYTIERKGNGDYAAIATLPVNRNKEPYLFSDKNPAPGANWYRLKINFKNGQTGYSNSISLSGTYASSIFPNPATDVVYISLQNAPGAPITIELIDLSGKVVYTRVVHAATSGVLSLRREDAIPKGLYLLRLTNPALSTKEVHKVVFD